METNPVVWFEIYVDDMDRAQKFYETVLDVTLNPMEPPSDAGAPGLKMMGFDMSQEKMGAAGALVKMEGMSPGGFGTMVYFACQDCAIEAGRAADAGGSLEQAKFSIGEYGFVALIKDTEGNMVGLHSAQ